MLSTTRRRRCGCIALLAEINVHVDDANAAGLEYVHTLLDCGALEVAGKYECRAAAVKRSSEAL
jgi:hypothetical protein